MDFSILISPSLGVLVGILMGLTGAGGGILSVPLLVLPYTFPLRKRLRFPYARLRLQQALAHYWDLEIRFSAIKQRA